MARGRGGVHAECGGCEVKSARGSESRARKPGTGDAGAGSPIGKAWVIEPMLDSTCSTLTSDDSAFCDLCSRPCFPTISTRSDHEAFVFRHSSFCLRHRHAFRSIHLLQYGDSPFRGGLIDEVAFYGSALSGGQILNHFNLALNDPGAYQGAERQAGALLQLTNIPEPTGVLLLGIGGLALLGRRTRRLA